jgi:hypothetical protein
MIIETNMKKYCLTPKAIIAALVICGTLVSAIAQIQRNTSIKFYGKVVDQNGQPIAGATVKLVVAGDPSEFNVSPGKDYTLETGQDGKFRLMGAFGWSMQVSSIAKPGYELSTKAQLGFSYLLAPDIHHPDANAPVLFKMWKRGISEPLVGANKIYKIIPDGQPYTIDLLKYEEKPGASPPGDIIVRINRPEKLAPGKKFDWSYSIEAVEGGIIHTNSDFLYQAPETGYEPKYEYSATATNAHWFGWSRDQFYIKSRGGQVYGSFEVEVSSDYNGGYAAFRIVDSALNPSGSRNLER